MLLYIIMYFILYAFVSLFLIHVLFLVMTYRPLLSNVVIRSSPIQGDGLFSRHTFYKGDVIISNIFPYKHTDEVFFDRVSPHTFDNSIILEGKYINHCSKKDNSKLVTKDNKVYSLVAKKNIKPDEEITSNYNHMNRKYPFIAPANSNYKKC